MNGARCLTEKKISSAFSTARRNSPPYASAAAEREPASPWIAALSLYSGPFFLRFGDAGGSVPPPSASCLNARQRRSGGRREEVEGGSGGERRRRAWEERWTTAAAAAMAPRRGG